MSIHARRTRAGMAYDVRLRDQAGQPYKRTFRTKREADTFQAREKADRSRGGWVDPRAGRVRFGQYAESWLHNRPSLRPRTRELYDSQLRLHLLPVLAPIEMGDLTTSVVRKWHADMVRSGRPGPVTVAKCYRLLRTIMSTAVEDGLVVKNPCVLKGAGVEHSQERPVASVPQVYALAAAIDPRYRVLVLTATFTGLRLGELAALTRRRLDLMHGTVAVVEQLIELRDGTLLHGPPKTDAGRRTVKIPGALLPDLRAHLEQWSGPGPDGLVFCGAKGSPLRRGHFNRKWRAAVEEVGMHGLHFHDLRVRHEAPCIRAG